MLLLLMRDFNYHYVYQITNLNPIDEKQFYVGVHSCDCLPVDDTGYMGSSVTLKEAYTNEGMVNFQKIILKADFVTREEADRYENAIHIKYDAAINPQFYNKKNGIIGFHTTPESVANHKATVNSILWKATKGKEVAHKHKKTINNSKWKETTGKERIEKCKTTLKDPDWKATKGKERIKKYKSIQNETSRKHSEVINDPDWLLTVGVRKIQNYKKTVNNKEWKDTVGNHKNLKIKKTKSDPNWIAANTFTCPHCDKTMTGRGNFDRWHNDNCKQKA